ncbi:YMD3 protein, partial [Pseudoatta argentina]
MREIVFERVQNVIQKHDNIKINTVFNGEFMSGDKRANKNVSTRNYKLFHSFDLHEWYTSHVVEPILIWLEEFQKRDSERCRVLNLTINKYNPLHTGCHIELSREIKMKKKFENLNVYCIENQKEIMILPLRLTDTKRNKHVNLLYMQNSQDDNMRHFALIKDLSSNISIGYLQYQRHNVFSIRYYAHCSYDDSLSVYRFRRDIDCIAWFVEELRKLAHSVNVLMADFTRDRQKFNKATYCYVCEKLFTPNDTRVRCVKLRFIDSCKFLASSLDKLASFLSKDKLQILQRKFYNLSEENFSLLTRRGIFPFEYVNCVKKLQEMNLPSRESFYSLLTSDIVSESAHATNVWQNTQAWKHAADFYLWSIKLRQNKLINLLESPYGIPFENVYVYSKWLQQPKYRYLENLLTPIKKMDYFRFSNKNVVSLNEALPNSIFVFDDVSCDKQDVIREYFAMGRHADIDCFYLCQTYVKIPKHLIRHNVNLILFKQDGINLKHVYNDHANTDMSYENFCELLEMALCDTAIAKIIRVDGRCPKNLQTDMRKEFYNANVQELLKKHNIHNYSTYSIMKAFVVEWFNRTLKNDMWKQFTHNGNYKWVDLLARFKVGNSVHVSKFKMIFEKGYTSNWTTEVFRIIKVQKTNSIPFCPTCDKLLDKREDKLLATMHDKKCYVIHYRNLQQCLYKLMNNAVFDKIMKNVRNHVDVSEKFIFYIYIL